MTLTCHHFCPLTLENTLQAITGRIPPAGTHICHYTPSWVMSESYGFSWLSPSATQTPPGQLLSENSKKHSKNQKISSMSISIKVVGIPQFLAPLAFLARKAPKKVAALRARTAGSLIWWRLRPQSAPPGQSMPQY